MKKHIGKYLKKSLLLFTLSGALILNASNVNFEKEKSIHELLEEQNPSISFSFSKDIIDFFDADVDWKNKKKHLEGDFSRATFFAFNENSSIKELEDLYKSRDYNKIKIEDDSSEDGEIIMYVSNKGKDISEAHFVVKSDDKVIIFSLYGEMKLKEKK